MSMQGIARKTAQGSNQTKEFTVRGRSVGGEGGLVSVGLRTVQTGCDVVASEFAKREEAKWNSAAARPSGPKVGRARGLGCETCKRGEQCSLSMLC